MRRGASSAALAARVGAAIAFATAALLACGAVLAQDPDAAAKALIARYVATWDVDALLAEPAISGELDALLGRARPQLDRALAVTAGVEYRAGALAVAGNGRHQGGELEAIVCIQPFGKAPQVHVAVLDRGKVVVYTRQKRWDFLPTCIRDWATLALVGTEARMRLPAGVQLGRRIHSPRTPNIYGAPRSVFEKIVLRRTETGSPITAGQIAEALLFYQNVHLLIDMGSLGNLVRQLGVGNLLTLLNRSDCSAVYCEEILGTQSHAVGPLNAHAYAAFTLIGHDGVGMFKTREDRVAYMLRSKGVSASDAKRFARLFLRVAPPRKLSGDYYVPGGITAAARHDMADPSFVNPAINTALALTPGAQTLGAMLQFDIQDSDLGMYVFNNIDFAAINARRAALRPPLEPVTVAHLLTHILEARADLALASFYGGDFATSEVTSAIVQIRYADIFRRQKLNQEELASFHQVTLPDYPSLRETIDSGQRTFKEYMVLLDKAAKFKEWLRSANVDEGLLRSYMASISKEGWIQSVPAKTVRYVFTQTLEAFNPLLGVATAVADNFIIEKLLSGWRPNHFVEYRLAPFIVGPKAAA
ncbi:MAG: hypothetical protein K1X74_23530 [Pirellulales bacterium]|nr:hypothetical protein [Pirellulales bacterium]